MPGLRQLLRVLRHRDFRLRWLANSASVVGDRIVTVAIALFVLQLTRSATEIGLVLAAYSVRSSGFSSSAGSTPTACRATLSWSAPTSCASCCTARSRCSSSPARCRSGTSSSSACCSAAPRHFTGRRRPACCRRPCPRRRSRRPGRRARRLSGGPLARVGVGDARRVLRRALRRVRAAVRRRPARRRAAVRRHRGVRLGLRGLRRGDDRRLARRPALAPALPAARRDGAHPAVARGDGAVRRGRFA